jgi:hypothetical protein
MDAPTTAKAITRFIHCAACMRELPDDESPESYARLSIGITDAGIQVWCVRHDLNVAHLSADDLVDFMAHPPACPCGAPHNRAERRAAKAGRRRPR